MTHSVQDKLRRYLERILPVAEFRELAEPAIAMEIVSAAVAPGRKQDTAASAVRKLASSQMLTSSEQFTIEAIVLPDKRPVFDIVDNDFTISGSLFAHFATNPRIKLHLRNAIPAIGRIDFPDHPTLPYGGTGFVVGDGLLMTNRHVAELFTSGLGTRRLAFHTDFGVGIDFRRERGRADIEFFVIDDVLMIHPYWDMALLSVSGSHSALRRPLRLSLTAPEDLPDAEIAVIGYPAFDPRNNPKVQNRVFGGVYYVKRLQPGRLTGRQRIRSFGHVVDAASHDTSTLGGNSGSAVIDIRTGNVVALHFAGRYLEANYAVPASELARDTHVVDAGVSFAGEPQPGATGWDAFWPAGGADEGGTIAASKAPAVVRDGDSVAFRFPIELNLTVSFPNGCAACLAAAQPQPGAVVERMVEPFHDLDYSSRAGYDANFLGRLVPLPEVTRPDLLSAMADGKHVIPYHHFSLAMHKERRLAVFTAANVDARPQSKRPDGTKDYTRDGLGGLQNNDTEKWFVDPRIPEHHQLPDRFFNKDRKAFDKGHIVRREAVAWGGDYPEVRFANGDTFHGTNCSPPSQGLQPIQPEWAMGQAREHCPRRG